MFQAIIFDLDGTLIDSRAAILDAFGKALAEKGIAPRIALSAVRIGPPLAETLRELTGSSDAGAPRFARRALQGALRQHWLPGQRSLRRHPRAARSADSKRRALLSGHQQAHRTDAPDFAVPAVGAVLRRVYALDRETPRLPDKSSMLARLLAEQALDAQNCIYVGDTPEDEAAARANGLPFAAVSWGYGEFPNTDTLRFSTPRELGSFLSQGKNAR
jgi:phosphoglycolate phosphatase